MFKVFVSYSTQDLRNVTELQQSLVGTGVEVFVAEHSVLPSEHLSAKIPETLTSVATLATAAGALIKAKAEPGKQVICTPAAVLYPIDNGIPNTATPIVFPVKKELVDVGSSD